MSNFDETIRYVDLLSLYSNLLSETQKEVLEDYYSYNLSISEIAENRNISRAAVEDAIKKGKTKLEDYEQVRPRGRIRSARAYCACRCSRG